MREKVLSMVTKLAMEKKLSGTGFNEAIDQSIIEALKYFNISKHDFALVLIKERGQALING